MISYQFLLLTTIIVNETTIHRLHFNTATYAMYLYINRNYYREMGTPQHHNINWFKNSVFCCFIILSGSLFYVYNMEEAHTDLKEYEIDIKVCQ